MNPLRIDPIAGAVALLAEDIPDVPVHGDDTPDTRPAIVVRAATGPSDPDLPLITSRIDVRVYGDPNAASPVDHARYISARVFAALHRTYLRDVQVAGYDGGEDTYRKYRSFSAVGEQLVPDPDTDEEYVFDTYEVTWASHAVSHRQTADTTVSVTA